MNMKTLYKLLLDNYEVLLLAEFTTSWNFSVWIRLIRGARKECSFKNFYFQQYLRQQSPKSSPIAQLLEMLDKG